MSEISPSASGPDLRPLGADSSTAPGLGATPLVPIETERIVSGDDGAAPTAHPAGPERRPALDPGADGPGVEAALPAVPVSMPREAARRVRTALDPLGHWDAVVACPVRMGPQGESSPLLRGALHIFLTPSSLMRQLGGPAGAERFSLKVTRGRLLTLLHQGLTSGPQCSGFWIYGMEDHPEFLPCGDLEPLAETIETVLLLARASTGGIALSEAVTSLSSRTFFHLGGWNTEADEEPGNDSKGSGEPGNDSQPDAAVARPQTNLETSISHDGFHMLPLYVSPVSLLKSGHVGQVATARLDEIAGMLEGYDGVVVEPGTGYSLVLSRDQLLMAVSAESDGGARG
ncbi:SseB family protein [Actinomycetaceae bacterium L2_0104]